MPTFPDFRYPLCRRPLERKKCGRRWELSQGEDMISNAGEPCQRRRGEIHAVNGNLRNICSSGGKFSAGAIFFHPPAILTASRKRQAETMETFWIKPKLYFGPEPMAALDQLAGKRVLIVTDAFLASSGLLDRVKNRLTGAVEIFDQVEPDPSLRLVAQGVRMLRDFGPSAVVPRWTAPRECAGFQTATRPCGVFPPRRGPAARSPPSPSSQTRTRASNIRWWRRTFCRRRPYWTPLCWRGCRPMSPPTRAWTCSHTRRRLSRPKAPVPSPTLWRRRHSRWPTVASCMAGMAFNAAGLGVCHSMAHALGGRFHVPHGRLNALLLPGVIQFNAVEQRTAEKYARLAKLCGLAANPRALSSAVTRLRSGLKIPLKLPVPAQEFRAALPGLAAAALQDVCLPGNPRPVTAGEIEAMLREIGG